MLPVITCVVNLAFGASVAVVVSEGRGGARKSHDGLDGVGSLTTGAAVRRHALRHR